jgi:probable rRNA maturation factor
LHVDRRGRKGYARRVTIALTIEQGPHEGIQRAEILRRVKAMIRLLQLGKAEVSFVLTDDERIHQLNKVYRHKDRPTDVLAFAMHEGEFGELAGHLLGDVIVSVPTARRQANARRTPLLDEVTMLLAHGLLHLLGWDHETVAKDRLMKAETSRLCAAAVTAVSPTRRVKVRSKGGAATALTRKRASRATGVPRRKAQ